MNDRKQYLKEYYLKNKEKFKQYINKNKSKMVRCECCDKDIKYFSLSFHRKTAKHIKNESNFNVNDKMLEKKIIECLRKIVDF